MTTTQEALKMASLFMAKASLTVKERHQLLQACKEALEQQEQEPVAFVEVTEHHRQFTTSKAILLENGVKLPDKTWLYTHPAKQLTITERSNVIAEVHKKFAGMYSTDILEVEIARAIEAKIRGE